MRDLDDLLADLVGRPDDLATADSTTGKENGHRLRVVIAADLLTSAHAVVGRASELAARDDERLVEHAPRLEIGDERGEWLIDRSDATIVSLRDVVVRVPTRSVNLDEADTLLDESAGEKTTPTDIRTSLVVETVALPRLCRLS